MLTLVEVTEIYEAVAARGTTEYERASIERLLEIVGRDHEKIMAALVAHALATSAVAHDLSTRLDERMALVEASAARVAERIEAAENRIEKRVAALPAAMDNGIKAAARASASLCETASSAQAFVLNDLTRNTLLKFRDEALPALMTASVRQNINETLKKSFLNQALIIAGTSVVALVIGYFIGSYLKG
jgi:hypothetical protein